MPTHPQIVIAAPDRHLGAIAPRAGVILSKREVLCTPVDGLEDSVRVVVLFLGDLLNQEAVIVKARANYKIDERYVLRKPKHVMQ